MDQHNSEEEDKEEVDQHNSKHTHTHTHRPFYDRSSIEERCSS